MQAPVVTKDPKAVEAEVQSAYRSLFPEGDPAFVPKVFSWATLCFTGGCKGYFGVDVPYHDFEHTLQGTLCMTQLLLARHRAGAEPRLTDHLFQMGLMAILLHDTGYFKRRDDLEGTGAKYTATHVDRSAVFAAEMLRDKGYSAADIKAVQNMIHCTGMESVLNVIQFQSDLERMVGFALGTADLLGQMAAGDYVERLPDLFAEFVEAERFSKNTMHFVSRYPSAEELMRQTPEFWEQHVKRKLNRDFAGLYQFLNDPYPDGPNDYMQRIEANMARLRKRLTDAGKIR
jgi:hypothetical protein